MNPSTTWLDEPCPCAICGKIAAPILGATCSSTEGPSNTPASISPITRGCFIRVNKSPSRCAAASNKLSCNVIRPNSALDISGPAHQAGARHALQVAVVRSGMYSASTALPATQPYSAEILIQRGLCPEPEHYLPPPALHSLVPATAGRPCRTPLPSAATAQGLQGRNPCPPLGALLPCGKPGSLRSLLRR